MRLSREVKTFSYKDTKNISSLTKNKYKRYWRNLLSNRGKIFRKTGKEHRHLRLNRTTRILK